MTNQIKAEVQALIGSQKPQNALRAAELTCIRHSATCPDYDGLVSSFKHIIDALVCCSVLEDDSMDHIGMPKFVWQKADRGQRFSEIFVTEVV